MGYHTFVSEEGDEHGSFEVFYLDQDTCDESNSEYSEEDIEAERVEVSRPGWYWWSCFPGCMPDGDPNGPFKTEEGGAFKDAKDMDSPT